MRVLLLLDRPPECDPIREALSVRGHQVSIASRDVAIADVTSPTFSSVDLIIADAEIAAQTELVPKLTAASPGIEFVLIGATSNPAPADVLDQLERPLDLERLSGVVDEVADILDGEHLREPVDLVAYETVFAGDSPQILAMLRRVRLVARSE